MSKLTEIEKYYNETGDLDDALVDWLIARVRKLETALGKVRDRLASIAESEATMGVGDIEHLLAANDEIHSALKES